MLLQSLISTLHSKGTVSCQLFYPLRKLNREKKIPTKYWTEIKFKIYFLKQVKCYYVVLKIKQLDEEGFRKLKRTVFKEQIFKCKYLFG